MCRPQFIRPEDNNYKPYLELRKMRHPCVLPTFNAATRDLAQQTLTEITQPTFNKRAGGFIPNDTIVG
jgi:hypothetical protein